ncbi:MFS-type transporter clz9-like [Melitaea cinxia]|uniref:MFS-type transporter clz9-like n=1 Tax=Melitaea cinxia TaxID=113334 RepID=UPI001E26F4C4|nr:MFS-type transporter clz9-like [Melitaea cinxia]
MTVRAYNISKSYLADIVKKVKEPLSTYTHDPNIGNRRIFSQEQEAQLTDYLKRSSKMCYGLTTTQVKELAYQFAAANHVAPEKWIEQQKATKDWFRGFMKRNPSLSLRKPENSSLSRATSFNQENVGKFYENLANVLNKKKIEPHMIWNLDETGCLTVTNPPKVIATRGCKQVGQVTSTERGQLVTMLGFINASGGTVPPVFVFPRVHFKEFMLQGCPKGALGLANPSGWITEESFYRSMIHFIKYVKPSEENLCLLLCDNHSSHITIDIVTLARDNHITILTFPPHCSHRLQPLDVSVYGPFKARYREAMNAWMISQPGKTVPIYEVAQFANTAYVAAFSMENVIAGFQKTGIHPFNKNTFTEDDFLTSFVTDRPMPELRDAEVTTDDAHGLGAKIPSTVDAPPTSADILSTSPS